MFLDQVTDLRAQVAEAALYCYIFFVNYYITSASAIYLYTLGGNQITNPWGQGERTRPSYPCVSYEAN